MGRPRRRQRPRGMEAHQSEQRIEYCGPLGPLYTQSQLTNLDRSIHVARNTACELPVTTRGIGFIISRVTSNLRQHLPEDFIPVAAIYRLSLTQLQLKMTKRRYLAHTLIVPHIHNLFENNLKKFKFFGELESYCRNLSQVALVINSIGSFTFNNKHFHPVFYKERSPLNLRIDNLREYCKEMANPETDSSKRVAGFELNSIPNAKWARLDDNDPKSVVLTNPDEVIPSDYLDESAGLIHEDATCVDNFIYSLRNCPSHHRSLKMWGEIDYECNGNPGLLVSTHVIPGQSLALQDGVISGDATEFWALERIPRNFWSLGVLALIGEVMNQMDGTVRSKIGGPRCVLSWRGVSDITL